MMAPINKVVSAIHVARLSRDDRCLESQYSLPSVAAHGDAYVPTVNDGDQSIFPRFSSDLASLIWPMSAKDFVADGMHANVFFQRGGPQRLSLLEQPLGGFHLDYLFAHGEDATIWREGGLRATRGSDSDQDVHAIVPGVTVQTHLQNRSAFCRRLISSIAKQMNLASGFCTIFASLDTYTATHFDRNYNFTIQLHGEKTWTVQHGFPAVAHPSANLALEVDRLSSMQPQLHGATLHEPEEGQSVYTLRPGDILYVPPGYWHATNCDGLSVSLNLCIEPWAWFQTVGDALLRHLEAQPEWRVPRGASTAAEAAHYLRSLKRIVDAIDAEDLVADSAEPSAVLMDQPLRRTLGSLLMWDKQHAGVHYSTGELRFLAKGMRGRLLDTLSEEWEPALALLAGLDRPACIRDLSTMTQMASEEMQVFVQRLVDVGYLAPASSPASTSNER